MPFLYNMNFYYIFLGLQAICVIHCMRKGNQNKWIWVIVFVPFVGCLAYFFTEIYRVRSIDGLGAGLRSIFVPPVRISKLEDNLRFSDTFNNRIALADAYLAAGRTEEAIELYESSLTGAFTENEHVLLQLIAAYFPIQRYDKVVSLGRQIYTRPQFARSRAHILYAMALGYLGQSAAAEEEFRKMKVRFANFESRYQFGCFLVREGREEEGLQVFRDIVKESAHLSSRERRDSRAWINLAKEELKKSTAKVPA